MAQAPVLDPARVRQQTALTPSWRRGQFRSVGRHRRGASTGVVIKGRSWDYLDPVDRGWTPEVFGYLNRQAMRATPDLGGKGSQPPTECSSTEPPSRRASVASHALDGWL